MTKLQIPKDKRRKVTRSVPSHPCKGGSRGYSVAQRQESIVQGAKPMGPSLSSLGRWKKRLIPYKSTGNKLHRKLTGQYAYALVLFRSTYPLCTADELRTFLLQAVAPPVLFSRSEITYAEQQLNFSRKRGSTTANQALLPVNVIRRQCFWTLPPPHGVLGVDRLRLIDSDECGLSLQSANRRYGKAYICNRVRGAGHYGHGTKLTLIMAISCDGFMHVQLRDVAGNSTSLFL